MHREVLHRGERAPVGVGTRRGSDPVTASTSTSRGGGGDLMLEKPGVYRIRIEGIYYGRQVLDDNPYRSESKPLRICDGDAMRQFGPVEVVANFENLLDVRQTEYQPLVRPSRAVGVRSSYLLNRYEK